MAGLVLMAVLVIFMARFNPFLTGIVISGVGGYFIGTFFARFGAPPWVIPLGIIFGIATTAREITDFLKSIVPPRRNNEPERPQGTRR